MNCSLNWPALHIDIFKKGVNECYSNIVPSTLYQQTFKLLSAPFAIIMTKTVINQGHLTVWWIREFPVPVNWTRALKVGKTHWKGKDRNNCMTLIHLVQGSRTQVGLRQLLVLSSHRRANIAVRYYNKLQYFWKCLFFFISIVDIIIQNCKQQFVYIFIWLAFNS